VKVWPAAVSAAGMLGPFVAWADGLADGSADADGLLSPASAAANSSSEGLPEKAVSWRTTARTTAAAPATNGPNIPAADTAAGQTFTGELVLNGSPLGVELNGTDAPQATAVFKSLSDEGYFSGKTCHRLTTGETFGVLQCGSPTGDGQGDPDYTWGPLENTPADGTYPAGTIAVARTGNNAYGNGTQFFIVYKDTVIPSDSAGGYTVVGKVTSGLDVVANLAAAGITPGSSDTDGAPVEPVTIDSFSLK